MTGGRQKSFDKTQALDSAMHVFWQKGFLGASLADLTEAMGINKPSMYSTFGNKEELFMLATDHYLEEYAKPHMSHLEGEGSYQKRLKSYLMSVISNQCEGPRPKGCYISLCMTESASQSLPAQALEMILKVRDFTESFFAEWLSKECTKEIGGKDERMMVMARLIITVLHGTAAMARSGRTIQELEPVVDLALNAFSPD
jgi:AcrR family transcriptional regulator